MRAAGTSPRQDLELHRPERCDRRPFAGAVEPTHDCVVQSEAPTLAPPELAAHGDASPPRRRWYTRPRWIVLAVVMVVLAGGATAFWILWAQRGAHEVSIDQAVDDFRKQHGASTTSGFLRPPAGVYTYTGTGTERLSLLKTTQHWGPRIPVTVVGDDAGCWTFRVDYSSNHWQSTRFCRSGRVLTETSDTTHQSFDFVAMKVSDTNTTRCRPPIDRVRVAAEPGEQWHASCTGRSESRGTEFLADGTETYVGIDRIRVGDKRVPAYHYRTARELSGSQTGSERYDMWYSVLDGLPVQTDRHVEVQSPSPIGTVTYTENGHYTLSSLVPRR
jgi:hypothetical protein